MGMPENGTGEHARSGSAAAPALGELSSPSSVWSRLRPLLNGRRRWVAALALGSVLSGLTESGILAILAQVAASLVDGKSHVHIETLHLDASLGALLAVALGLAILRFALQMAISYIPARVAADMQAQLRSELFASFTRSSWVWRVKTGWRRETPISTAFCTT